MSKTSNQKQDPALGAWLRDMRLAKKLPLRTVAAAADMDSTHLSKIELGQRLPTTEQAGALARFFHVPVEEVEARRIASKLLVDYGGSSSLMKALAIVREHSPTYNSKKRS